MRYIAPSGDVCVCAAPGYQWLDARRQTPDGDSPELMTNGTKGHSVVTAEFHQQTQPADPGSGKDGEPNDQQL